MSRNFLGGLIVGLLVSLAGLAIVSQLMPPGKMGRVTALSPAQTPVAKAFKEEPPLAAAPVPATADIDLKAAKTKEAAAPEAGPPTVAGGDAAAQVVAAEPSDAAAAPSDAAAAPKTARPPKVAATEPAPSKPVSGASEAPDAAVALGSGADPVPAQPEPVAPASPSADLAPVPDTGTMPAPRQDTLLDPPAAPQSPATEPTPDLPNPDLPAPDATPKAATVPAQDTAELAPLPQTPAPESEPQIPAEGPALVELGQAILPPAPGLSQGVVGVTTNRLPRIGDAAPDTAKDEVAEIADSRPIKAFARPFQPEADKPVFAILLRDIGAAGMDRAELTKLPFAVTFVIDPLAPDAAAAMAAYRAAGQEVAILAMLPQNATPSDLEQSFQSLALSLPESVAFVDAPKGGLQENRALAAQAIPILKAQGRGIVTYDRGLGAADQVARREGLATASIFRELDAEAEGTPAVRRYLDRAAFKAAQEGRVVVIGQTRPETVAAILEWLVEGRGATVSVAPLSAAMQGDE